MKKLILITLITSMVTLMAFKIEKEKSDYNNYNALETSLNNAKAYTIEVLQAMKESDYSYKPTENVRTFGAQAFHIAYSIDYFNQIYQGKNATWNPRDENSKSKKELIEWTKNSFDKSIEIITNATNKDQIGPVVSSFLEHNAHHRGQMVTYLRMKNIEPPKYK